jgi:general L-amino acid transport system permease protein
MDSHANNPMRSQMNGRLISQRPPPAQASGWRSWLKQNFFASRASSAFTLTCLALLLYWLPSFIDWAVVHAVFRTDSDACRAALDAVENSGACWGVVHEKYRAILFGRYPFDQQWRPLLALVALIAALVLTCRAAIADHSRLSGKALLLLWTGLLIAVVLLLRGGFAGLTLVESSRWGGLPLTLLLSIGGVAAASPLAVLLALGRLSSLPALRTLSVFYIELIRSIPLVSILFVAAFLFPLFVPKGVTLDVLLRAWVALALFAAAYLAEVLRGGLQAIPKGQREAASALGLSYWQTQRRVVLPQVLRSTLPSLMNSFIGIIKETSLVTVVSLYELTGALSLALAGDPNWRQFYLEGYLFIALIYWFGCFALSRYSQHLAQRLNSGKRAL